MVLPPDYDYSEDELFHFYYDAGSNIFYYDGNFINYLIHDIMTPNEVRMFKINKEDIIVRTNSGDLYAVYYVE